MLALEEEDWAPSLRRSRIPPPPLLLVESERLFLDEVDLELEDLELEAGLSVADDGGSSAVAPADSSEDNSIGCIRDTLNDYITRLHATSTAAVKYTPNSLMY